MHNCLKRKCGNTTPQSCPKENILRIQFRKIAPKKCRVRMQFRRIASQRRMQHPQNDLGRNGLMTLTQGHNFDLGFLTQGQI
jgi:hypothetical protein